MLVSRFLDGIAGSAFLSVAGKIQELGTNHRMILDANNMIGGTVGDVSRFKGPTITGSIPLTSPAVVCRCLFATNYKRR